MNSSNKSRLTIEEIESIDLLIRRKLESDQWILFLLAMMGACMTTDEVTFMTGLLKQMPDLGDTDEPVK